jgi:DNA polymerase
MLAWISGQTDLLKQFELGEDIYSNFASRIYNEAINEKEHSEKRFVGKTAILGLGYGMGARKFESTLKIKNISLEPGEAQKIVATYRTSYSNIVNYWRLAESLLNSCVNLNAMGNRAGPIYVGYKSLVLPNNLSLRYKDLHYSQKEGWRYRKRKNWVNIYGGSITENIVQALSRIIITDAMLEIERKFPEYRIVLTVHDEIVIIAKDNKPTTVLNNIITTMCQPPDWCESLPLAAKGGYSESYSK